MSSSSTPTPSAAVPPNHHAHHPGFSGIGGAVAAVKFLGGRARAADLAIELATPTAGDRVIDIGCGPGVAARRARSTGAQVIGIDPSAAMLRVAQLRWVGSGIEWRTGTAESLGVDDASATVAWSLATVHHWVDLDAGLAETHRALEPGGRFLAMERRIDDPFADGVASHGWTVEQAETFAELCRGAGFIDVATDVHPGTPELVTVSGRRA